MMVAPRMIQATAVQMKMKMMAARRLAMRLLEVPVAPWRVA
jgi:hypothetical protein